MAKRLADTDKYKKKFIRSLPGAYKLLWDYICLDCNHAGIWEVDFEVAQLRLGSDMQVNEQEAIKLFNLGEERIKVLNGGSKWFIRPFIDFQYGNLDPNNRVHASVLRLLKEEGIKGLTRPLQGAKDKDKDNNKDKDMVKDKYLDFVLLTKKQYQELIDQFGLIETEERIKRLNEYGHTKPKKFKEYGSHYHTILVWARKDKPEVESNLTKAQKSNLQGLARTMEVINNDIKIVSGRLPSPDSSVSGATI